MAKKLDIEWPELQFAFDSSFGEASCYLDRETGTVVTVTEDLRAAADDEEDAEGFDPRLLEAVRAIDGGSERYLPIPDQESREGYRDMEEFVTTVRDPRLAELLEVAIAGAGPSAASRMHSPAPPVSASAGVWRESRQHERILDWLARSRDRPGQRTRGACGACAG